MACTTNAATISLKLLVNKATNEVIFAEANKDFVDFLFHILSLPVGTIISLLSTNGVIGSIGNLYESLQDLTLQYLQPTFNKDCLLKPTTSLTCLQAPSLPRLPTAQPLRLEFGQFPYQQAKESSDGGYVKGVVSYMVMDDPSVQPVSTISGITLLSKFGVKDVSDLEEKLVSLGFDERLSLLKASLQSQTVLTDVFLGERDY